MLVLPILGIEVNPAGAIPYELTPKIPDTKPPIPPAMQVAYNTLRFTNATE